MNNNELTFADIPPGQWFFMDFAGQRDQLFEKTSETECRCRKINGEGYVTMKAARCGPSRAPANDRTNWTAVAASSNRGSTWRRIRCVVTATPIRTGNTDEP